MIGFVNPNVDNPGAYGIEAQYDDALSGETGRIVTAKNGDGTQMLYRYEDYYDATDGDNLTLTLDSAIQSYCESILKKGIEQFEVQDGGFCIAMDPNTGEILAWANSPTYDLNNPRVVSDPVLNQYLADIESGAYIYGQAAVDESIGLLRVEDFILDNATVEEKVSAGDTQGVNGDDPSSDGSSAEGTADEELEAAEATDMVPEDGKADQDAAGQE